MQRVLVLVDRFAILGSLLKAGKGKKAVVCFAADCDLYSVVAS